MAKYLMAQVANNLFRLRIELDDQIVQFSFLYSDKQYRILTYAFFDKEDLSKSELRWQEVEVDKVALIINLANQAHKQLMAAFETEPNF